MAELLVKREIRKRGSFSEFARLSGLHVSSVSQIVNGRLRPYPGQVEKSFMRSDGKATPHCCFTR